MYLLSYSCDDYEPPSIIAVSGSVEKLQELAAQHFYPEFDASNGWVKEKYSMGLCLRDAKSSYASYTIETVKHVD
jgi:hypothetical protein